jgi:hypothetical protein
MSTEAMTLDQALRASEQLSLADQLRLIGLLSERLRQQIDPTQAMLESARPPIAADADSREERAGGERLDITPEAMARTLREQGGRYVVDAQSRPVAVLLTLEEYAHYLDLLDDQEDSQDKDLSGRLALAAVPQTGAARRSLGEYLRQRPPADASLQG